MTPIKHQIHFKTLILSALTVSLRVYNMKKVCQAVRSKTIFKGKHLLRIKFQW